MIEARVRLDPRTDAEIPPGIFGGFVEHFGTGLYGGVWDLDRDHPRGDVMAAVRGMGVTALRYPGGCFADWYHWRDGVGDPASRPSYERQYWTDLQLEGVDLSDLSPRFGPPEPNRFGTDEFLRYCDDIGAEPLLTVNVGTGTPDEAAEWVAYVNRRERPTRPVKRWFLGNELYGTWELGHCSGGEYGRRFAEFATAMRAVDPEIQLVAVNDLQPRNHSWNAEVLQAAGSAIDLVSLHFYFPGPGLGRDLADTEEEVHQLLVGPLSLADKLDRAIDVIDDAGLQDVPVTLDEWNLWSAWPDLLARTHRLSDSVFFGGVFNRLIERAGRVRYAMISHLVNCMAPIQTSGADLHVTSAYLTFLLYRSAVRRFLAPVRVDAPTVLVRSLFAQPIVDDVPELGGDASSISDIALLDVAATADERGSAIFVCNGSLSEPARTAIEGLPRSASGYLRWLRGPDPFARNGFDAPDRLGFAHAPCATDGRGNLIVEIPPATVTAVVVDNVIR